MRLFNELSLNEIVFVDGDLLSFDVADCIV